MGYAGIDNDVLVYHFLHYKHSRTVIPDIIHNFELKDLAMAGFIPTSFFLAYAIMSIRQAY